MAAPPAIREAFEGARIDIRTAYLLARHFPDHPERITGWLAGEVPISRTLVRRELGKSRPKASRTLTSGSKKLYPLRGARGGRPGTLMLRGSIRDQATVRFSDGSESLARLREVTLTHWLRI